MSLAQLIQIVSPPAPPVETGSPKQWNLIQKRLGTPLPTDYKKYIDCYGTGTFNEFILPYNPFAKDDLLNLFQALDTHHQASRRTQIEGDVSWSVVHPYQLFPAPDGLLPWGTTANFEKAFFWQVSGPPETWVTVFYNLRDGEYEVWKLTVTNFLTKLLLMEIESVLLSEDFSSQLKLIRFVPYEY
jgi:hypothetical protein